MNLVGKWKIKAVLSFSPDRKTLDELLADGEDEDSVSKYRNTVTQFNEDDTVEDLMPVPADYTKEQIDELADKYLEMAENYGKFAGIHAHNNQQLAFANTITALTRGVSYLDATINGMGRGAGNCSSEQLLGFLKNPKYDMIPLLKFLEKHIVPLKESGVVWGYNIPYLLTGQMNRHPRSAIAATKEKRTDFLNFYLELNDKD